VKHASQRFWVLFIGAQKIVILACRLCKISGEKGHTPFTKDAEECEVYTFGIHFLEHFSSKIVRKR
jgi:hypothetical protein